MSAQSSSPSSSEKKPGAPRPSEVTRGTEWMDWPLVRPHYSEEDIQAMVDRGTIRLDGSKAFLLELWTFTGNERQIFDAIMGALRALEWRVEAPARMPRLVAQAEAKLTLPSQYGGAVIYAEFFMTRRFDRRLAKAGGLAFHKGTGQPFLLIPKDFDEVRVDPKTHHHWDFFVHGEKHRFEASLTGLAAEVARVLERRAPEATDAIYEPGTVAMHLDRPASNDRLGRTAFAEALAKRFRRIVRDSELDATDGRYFDSAFMVHLHAPWGAGKTSVLHLIARELGDASRNVKPWVIVNFNAWKHQRIDPPWWSLLDTIYRDSLRSLKGKRLRRAQLWLGEQHRRFSAGYASTVLAVAIAFAMASLGLYFWLSSGRFNASSFWSDVGGWAQNVTAILALLAGLWAGLLGFSRSLLRGSADAAQGFVRHTNDPMRTVSTHFRKLVDSFRQPAIIFIDDVDRCDRDFVIKLLEGVQTLFHHRRVIFLVAGDRRWINTCYESVYPHFVDSIVEPGRRLGALFLEKAFQLSVSLPQLSPERRNEYWNYLLNNVAEDTDQVREEAAVQARELLAGAESENEVLDQLTKGGENPLLAQAIREEIVKRLADREIEATSHHFLQRFAPLLEPNPRAMKRLVNAYGVYRDIAILSHLDFESSEEGRKKLALWTIVSLRWPILEEFLVGSPDIADVLASPPADASDLEKSLRSRLPRSDAMNADEAELVDLMKSPIVLKVFNARDLGTKLDAEAVRRLSALSSTAGVGATARESRPG